MTDETYHGWSNRETWMVNLWFGHYVTDQYEFNMMRDYVEDLINNLEGFLHDMIREDKINWEELERTLIIPEILSDKEEDNEILSDDEEDND